MRQLWLEDLASGLTFTSGSYEMSEAEIIGFAERYDPQPFHVDPALAADSAFDGLAASGWHTAGVTMRLLVECLPLAGGSMGLEVTVAWPTPTRPGDVLHVEGLVVESRPSRTRPGRGIVVLEYQTLTAAGEVRQRTRATAMVSSRD